MEHNLQTFNELQTFSALDNTVKSEIMKYYMVKDSEGRNCTTLFRSVEAAKERIRFFLSEDCWDEAGWFEIHKIDTRLNLIEEIETILR